MIASVIDGARTPPSCVRATNREPPACRLAGATSRSLIHLCIEWIRCDLAIHFSESGFPDAKIANIVLAEVYIYNLSSIDAQNLVLAEVPAARAGVP